MKLYRGDCVEVMAKLEPESVDAVVCDPPYSLEFMGRGWDKHETPLHFQQWCQTWAEGAMRVLKPGGHLLAFGGTRTYHRLTSGIEDAGFEIRDSVRWIHAGNKFCQCAEWMIDGDDSVRGVRDTVSGLPEDATQSEESDVFVPLQRDEARQGVGAARPQGSGCLDGQEPSQFPREDERFPQSSVAGRHDPETTEGQLQGSEVRPVSGGVLADGAEGRVHHGAPVGDGSMGGALVESGGSSASLQSHSGRQPERESGTVADERGSQTVGGWPLCRRCSKPLFPPDGGGLAWGYGSGFPKSQNVSKMIDKMAGKEREVVGPKMAPSGVLSSSLHKERANRKGGLLGETVAGGDRSADVVTAPATPEAEQWEGWGTALGPSHEPIVVARKPLIGTVAKNVLTHGTGAINIDGCRISGIKDVPASPRRAEQGPAYGDLSADPGTGSGWDPHTGRWPKNTILSHHEDCVEVGTRKLKVVGATAHKMEHSTEGIAHSSLPHEHAGFRDDDGTETIPAYQCVEGCPVAELDAQSGSTKDGVAGGSSSHGFRKDHVGGEPTTYRPVAEGYGGAGGASRFFYQAKSSKKDRNYGMPEGEKNSHPTVKPIKLMQYLVRLVTQPGGTVLDPFAGSGTCGIAAIREGFDYIGIEQDPEYAVLAATRIKFAMHEKKQEGTL